MTTTHVSGLDSSIHKTNILLNEVREELGAADAQGAYAALRGTLHALRDRLSVGEAAHLASQLPMVVGGIYYDGWRPTGQIEGRRSRDAFLEQVRAAFRPPPEGDEIDPEDAVRAVTRVLDRHIDEGQMRHVRDTLPEEIAELLAEAPAQREA